MAALNPSWEDRIYADAESSGALPDPKRQLLLSWGEVRSRVPKYEGDELPFVNKIKIDEMLELRDSKAFGQISEELWPPRTKTDLSLRRTRLLDYVKHFRRIRRMEELTEVLYLSRETWDLIWVTNLVAATAVLGIDWLRRWRWLGAFDGDLTHYIAVAKKVNDLGKTRGLADKDARNFVECAVMGGYRNPPFPGFDVVDETRKLAEGGEEHNYFGWTWDALVKEFLPMQFHPVVYMDFAEFVTGASWLTTGASSVGRLEIRTADGSVKKVKARKNMVADVIDLGNLATDALDATAQINFTIIKSELGKLRLAVAGDIYTYLKQTYVNYLLGGAYYDWPGNTTEETFEEQTLRLAKMLELASKMYGLPYDYAGFDHQPTTPELVGIVKRLCDHAALNVPPSKQAEFWEIANNVINGFSHSTLEVREGGKVTESFKVTGGLMSGLRWTSVVGNGWNSIMTGLALKVLNAWGISTSKIDRYIRGDDSAIFVPNWATGAAMNLAYDAVGAKGGEGKFSLQLNKMEFLRVWFDQRCYGYAARAIPGLTQRKPWSSNPWSEDMIIKALADTCRTLRRRVPARVTEINSLWVTLRRVWCQNHNLPEAVCWTPRSSGGFGLEPSPSGEAWRIEPAVPVQDTDKGLDVLNQNSWREDRLRSYFQERYKIELGDRAREIAKAELASTVTADNIPEIARIRRDEWLDSVRAAGCKAVVRRKVAPPVSRPVDVGSYQPHEIAALRERLRAHAPEFGKYPEVAIARKDYDAARPKMSFRDWLRQYYPRIAHALERFHRSWHRSEALDYLQGKIEIAPATLHPALTGILARVIAISYPPRKRMDRESFSWATALFEPWLLSTPLSFLTYQW